MPDLKIKKRRLSLYLFLIILGIGICIPQNLEMPVQGATKSDYNSESFWYYPWGKSVTHKGVDVFAKDGCPIHSSVNGLVLFTGEVGMGGNFVLVLGPKWRLHYFAHLKEIKTSSLRWVSKENEIGTVGSSGNAKGKAPHLHYSIVTPIPYLWRADSDRQGWRKMFYLNPIDYFEAS